MPVSRWLILDLADHPTLGSSAWRVFDMTDQLLGKSSFWLVLTSLASLPALYKFTPCVAQRTERGEYKPYYSIQLLVIYQLIRHFNPARKFALLYTGYVL